MSPRRIFEALEVNQPFGTFYLAIMPAEFLLDVAFSEHARAIQDFDDPSYRVRGTERKEDVKRHKDIGEFINTDECAFPTPIIIAANYSADHGVLEEDDARRWAVEKTGGRAQIVVPGRDAVASIVDGQNRLHGFNYARTDRRSIELACSVFFDLPNPYQAYLFATVNFNQKKVDRSLAYELFGFDTNEEPSDQWTPEKSAVFLCRRLNSDSASPLKGHIRIAPLDERSIPAGSDSEWKVSTATVVEGILKLISKNPVRDRNQMYRSRKNRKRALLDARDGSPLRSLHVDNNDLALYTLIGNYFLAVKSMFWARAKDSSYIIRTVGIQACFDVLSMLASDVMRDRDISAERFTGILAPAAKSDFSLDYYQASGIGRTRLRRKLLFDLKLLPEAELSADERRVFKGTA